jgi:hypothetical protein
MKISKNLRMNCIKTLNSAKIRERLLINYNRALTNIRISSESRKRKNNGKIMKKEKNTFRKKKNTLKIITAKYNLK